MTEQEFVAAFERHKDRVYRLALNYTKSRTDAEDISQNVFMKLLDQPAREPEYEKAWLIRVTINECKNLLRASWWKRNQPIDYRLSDTADDRSALMDDVMALPSKLRVVIHLHYYEGYTAKEIGEQLGISESAVQNRLMRARKKLKQFIEEGDLA